MRKWIVGFFPRMMLGAIVFGGVLITIMLLMTAFTVIAVVLLCILVMTEISYVFAPYRTMLILKQLMKEAST